MLADAVGAVRGVGGDVEQEGFVLIILHEAQGLIKEDVGAVTLEFFLAYLSVKGTLVGIIKVVIAVVVRGLADAAAFVPEDILEAFVLWAAGGVVAEVPLADHAGAITRLGEVLGDGELISVQVAAAAGSAEGPGAGRVAAGHQGRAGGGAEGADVEVGEADGLGV